MCISFWEVGIQFLSTPKELELTTSPQRAETPNIQCFLSRTDRHDKVDIFYSEDFLSSLLALLIPCPEEQQFVATPFAMQREKELSWLEGVLAP